MTPLEKAAAAAEAADMDHVSDEMWGVKVARAVLMAVREPSLQSISAGEAADQWERYPGLTFPAMIDAILAEEPKPT